MEELLNIILKNITTHPDDVVITNEIEDGVVVYTITVNPEDMGRVIGKSGKVIRSIRSLAHVIGIRKSERYRINVAEVAGKPSSPEEIQVIEVTEIEAEAPQDEKIEDDVIAGAITIESAEDTTTN
jgi:predicted RNA-binding protein YlqC (UPF0109 family)